MLTTKGDVRALDEVTKVAQELCPEIDVEGLLAVWRQYFKSTPWDPEQKVVGAVGAGDRAQLNCVTNIEQCVRV